MHAQSIQPNIRVVHRSLSEGYHQSRHHLGLGAHSPNMRPSTIRAAFLHGGLAWVVASLVGLFIYWLGRIYFQG